jgi:hypothetical protein
MLKELKEFFLDLKFKLEYYLFLFSIAIFFQIIILFLFAIVFNFLDKNL